MCGGGGFFCVIIRELEVYRELKVFYYGLFFYFINLLLGV